LGLVSKKDFEMKIAVVVPVMNQPEVTQQFIDQLRSTEGETKPMLVIIDNGSTPPVRDWLIGLRQGDLVVRNDHNVGVMPALNQGYQVLKNAVDFIFYTHNDVMIHEQGWDDKLVRILEEKNKPVHGDDYGIGVAGFYGAKGIGTPGIYTNPYVMNQLIRIENVSNCIRMDPVHGYRQIRGGQETEEVAVMDGFSLIVNVELLNKLGGFDRSYPEHHMYDADICISSLNEGYRNIVIAMDAYHSGGKTDVGEDWASGFGKTKQQIHTEAHPVFYEKWRPGKHKVHLPVRVA
jgi:GT2 family glycosyltransferase